MCIGVAGQYYVLCALEPNVFRSLWLSVVYLQNQWQNDNEQKCLEPDKKKVAPHSDTLLYCEATMFYHIFVVSYKIYDIRYGKSIDSVFIENLLNIEPSRVSGRYYVTK